MILSVTMTDTNDLAVALKTARKNAGLSLERAAGQLVPPVSSRTLFRWEEPGARFDRIDRRRFYIDQFRALYGAPSSWPGPAGSFSPSPKAKNGPGHENGEKAA